MYIVHSLYMYTCYPLQEQTALLTPHHLKERASGRPVVMVPIILYSDDTSANKSKKWHKMDSWCLLFAGLPRETNAQLASIHLICCSDTLSFLDMAEPIAAELTKLEVEGIVAYDAHLKQQVLVVAPVLCAICDNPRASEMVNHLGGAALCFCRMCEVSKHVNPNKYIHTRRHAYQGEQKTPSRASSQCDQGTLADN